MKRLLNIIMIAGIFGILFSACELEKYPYNAIATEQAFVTMSDAANHRNALYSLLRGRQYGMFTQTAELQSDLYNATADYGNRQGFIHQITQDLAGDYNVRDIWRACYSAIAQVNNFIENVDKVDTTTPQEEATIADYKAEAHYVRAYIYYILIKYFGAAYDPATASDKLGVPLLTTFDINAKPERASVGAIYDFIKDEITLAEQLTVTGEAKSERITIDAVRAFKARIQLLTRDYSGAAQTAQALINSGNYPLVTTEVALRASWVNDDSSEDIFLMFVSASEAGQIPAGSGSGNTEQNQSIYTIYQQATEKYRPDYIPTKTVVDMYEADDLRRKVFLSDPTNDTINLSTGSDYPDVLFLKKFPGNPAMFTTQTNYRHKPKVARIAEQYLIAAEALNRSGGNGLPVLNALRQARGASELPAWDEQEMQNEWVREMIGEGFRIECLKRWGIGYDGRIPQNPDLIQGGLEDVNFAKRNCPAGYYRFILPIPHNELRTNPNMVQTPEWIH